MSMIARFLHVPPEALQALEGDADAIVDQFLTDAALDVDKTWHAIHFLLTGSAWDGEGPAASAVLGGRDVSEDLGYGPARWLDPSEVREIATTLDEMDPKQLSKQFEAAKLIGAEIYPFAGASLDSVDPNACSWAVDGLKSLRAYAREAATAGHGMLVALL